MGSKVYISKSRIPKAGRGVFAAVDIKKSEIIEICPAFVLPIKKTGNSQEKPEFIRRHH